MNLKFIILIFALTIVSCSNIKRTTDGRVTGENWLAIPNTKILFSHYDQCENEICWKGNLEYFKKGDSLISIRKELADNFYNLFRKNPEAFSDIYRTAYVSEKSELTFENYSKKPHNLGDINSLDSIIQPIPFKTAVIIYDIQYINGLNEFVWVLTTINRNSFFVPQYISILFNKRMKYKATNKNPTDFEFKK